MDAKIALVERKGAMKSRARRNRQGSGHPDLPPSKQTDITDELERLCSSGHYEQAIILGESILELERPAPGQGEVPIFLPPPTIQLARLDPPYHIAPAARPHL